jgi:hypothetical protein
MARSSSSRVPAFVFGAGVAAVLAFGANSALAAPSNDAGGRFFCGFYAWEEGCQQCCGKLQHSWEGIECYCDTDTGSS